MGGLVAALANVSLLEVVGSVLSIAGAYIVARHGHGSCALRGWGAWIVAGFLWIAFAISNRHWFMLCTQACFLYTACLGFRATWRAARGYRDTPKRISRGDGALVP